jgi:hypothetical protein
MTQTQQQDFSTLCDAYRIGVITRQEFLEGAQCFLPSIDRHALEKLADQVLTNTDVTFGTGGLRP